jgi:hypothetical protein
LKQLLIQVLPSFTLVLGSAPGQGFDEKNLGGGQGGGGLRAPGGEGGFDVFCRALRRWLYTEVRAGFDRLSPNGVGV